ncbi:hypothetical protein [Candidatus Azobacteroides pseudotrichonymphae]|uniref:Outer membrane protein beta-barrel domain-containing protein n=1 Tax=Azobacteroides pseudotrichonymphae genomovar. CFP2 TaxID=511995 RepID=B6YRY7_AZOPC|nr:hypothetical protein [Candidatus Azobacteroides pseudotrichonymphae]BAG83959.1 hypothetical protein CFPG_696 [Candidatus Azobacteroides pseudotrichonymphae genomovar. CFP2]
MKQVQCSLIALILLVKIPAFSNGENDMTFFVYSGINREDYYNFHWERDPSDPKCNLPYTRKSMLSEGIGIELMYKEVSLDCKIKFNLGMDNNKIGYSGNSIGIKHYNSVYNNSDNNKIFAGITMNNIFDTSNSLNDIVKKFSVVTGLRYFSPSGIYLSPYIGLQGNNYHNDDSINCYKPDALPLFIPCCGLNMGFRYHLRSKQKLSDMF